MNCLQHLENFIEIFKTLPEKKKKSHTCVATNEFLCHGLRKRVSLVHPRITRTIYERIHRDPQIYSREYPLVYYFFPR